MKPLTQAEKAQLRKDTKSYHVAAVLDKASSDRLMRPPPVQCEVRGKDGAVLILTTASGAKAPGRPGRRG